MEHLDEGTIHAWIDGALGATQSREIEAHVAQCPTCSAAVAEARGLIAASSRILTALDDVPGGVVPKRVPGTLPPAATRQAPRWRMRGWVPAAAAAALILAVGLVQVNREKGVVAESRVTQDSFSPFRDQVAKLAADSGAARPLAAAPQTRPSTGESRAATAGPVAAIAQPPDASLTDGRSRAEGRIGGAAGVGATSPVAQRAPAPAPPAAPATKDEVVAESKVATLKSAAEATAAPAPDSARMRVDTTRVRRQDRVSVADVPALPQTLAGCYRVEREVSESLLGKAANVAGGVARATSELTDAKRARPPAVAPAPAPAAGARASATDFAAASLPTVVRLDTMAQPSGLRVLRERSDSLIGWWTQFGPDTARVRLLSGFALTLTAKNRVTCPER